MDRIAYAIRPGSYIVDSYPFLKHIPWFTSELKKYYQEDMALFHTQLQTVKERIVSHFRPDLWVVMIFSSSCS